MFETEVNVQVEIKIEYVSMYNVYLVGSSNKEVNNVNNKLSTPKIFVERILFLLSILFFNLVARASLRY